MNNSPTQSLNINEIEWAKVDKIGLEISFPYSQMVVDGTKTIETRTYPFPKELINKNIHLIESELSRNGTKTKPISKLGDLVKSGQDGINLIGLIIVTDVFEYRSKADWLSDCGKHCVDENDSNFGFKNDTAIFG
mmetsp:Transcript_14216/g.20100  ORF Transcript_14216/g.20100 Transcript_14216/m.20100 type:complete len:135 (+) Transcript_14216:2-406(+)